MLTALLLVQAATASAQQPLYLTCFGGGTANKVTVTTGHTNANVHGSVGGTSYGGSGNATTNVYGRRQQGFDDQVDIRLFVGDDRIRMPRTMLPPIHGGDDGWFKFKNVQTDARSIRGSAAVALLNNPKIHIDRVTGTISISGKAGDFTGQCQVVDTNTTPQF